MICQEERDESCPRCGSKSFGSTTMGRMVPDRNRAWCKCGWRGYMWEMSYEGRAEGRVLDLWLTDDVRDTAVAAWLEHVEQTGR